MSIKKKIYWSFLILVLLFVANGTATIITLNNNRKLTEYVSTVTNPSLQGLEDFADLLVASKMYTTNWVFLRSNEDDKDALKRLHKIDYPVLRAKLSLLSGKWDNQNMADSLRKIYAGLEELFVFERQIMLSLQKFEDYDDPDAKLKSEMLIEDELLPRTSSLINGLSGITLYELNIRNQKSDELKKSYIYLRTFISVLAVTIIFIGIFISLYMARIIIRPLNKIRDIVNDLGKGILQKVNYKETKDEMGKMVQSVNKLSEKLQAIATFAHETGLRNFEMPYKPLSGDDVLGKALIAMRDNIKSGDEKLNEAQHIAKLGSFERNFITGRLYMSDEMFNIFDIDQASYDYSFQSILQSIHPHDLEYFTNTVKKVIEDHQVRAYEFRIVSAHGITKNIFAQSKVTLDTHGNVIGTIGIVQDITERKRGEEKLAEERELFRLVIENMPDQIYLKDTESRFLLCNMPVAVRAGYASQAEVIGKTDFDFLPDKKANQYFHEEQVIMQTGIPIMNHEEHTVDENTGDTLWSLHSKFPLRNNSGITIGLIGIGHDITGRKIAEQELENVNRELSILFNSIDEIFFSVNMETLKVIQVSATCEKLYGYEQSEFMSNYALWFDIIHPDDRHLIENEDEEMKRGEQVNNQYRIIRKDKTIRWVETKITPTLNAEGKLTRVDGVTRDITKRKKAEIALLESQKQIQTIFNAALDAIIIIDEGRKIVKWDSKAEALFGWKEDEVYGMSLAETIIPHQYREAHNTSMNDFLKTGDGLLLGKTVEVRALNKYNLEFDISLSISPSFINDKYQFIGFIRDITSRKKAETELHNSEERYRQIVETAQEGIWMINENNDTTFINKKMCEIIEYSPEEIMGKKIHFFMDEVAKKNAAEQIERRRQGISETHDSKFITKSGKDVWTNLSTNPVFDADGIYRGALAMITDITKRKHDEELLRKSKVSLAINNHELEQKNKELEQFAYVASHDLQEPLRTIISFVEIFKQQYYGRIDSKADKFLSYIVQASDRMSVLIKDLLDFSRIGINKDMERVDCNLILENVITDLGKAIKESNAEIIAEPLPVIIGYATELKQLFQNLIINSIKFRKKNLPPQIKVTAQQKDDYWRFSFSDNGIGIDQQHYERIFIIFQRLHNRTDYDGSGIGLSHCKKIVELHHGKIWVESIPGHGSIFYFTLHSLKQKINETKIKLHNANR